MNNTNANFCIHASNLYIFEIRAVVVRNVLWKLNAIYDKSKHNVRALAQICYKTE